MSLTTKRRHAVALTAAIVGIATLLAACTDAGNESGDGTTDSSEGVTASPDNPEDESIHLLTFGVETGLGPTLEGFTEDTGIEVVPEYVTSADFPSILQTRVAGEADIDVINLRSGAEFNRYAGAGTFQVLDDRMILDRVSDGGKLAGTVDGEIYGFASNLFLIGVTYNKDLFESAGIASPPTTWDEFIDACEKLAENGIAPIAWSAADSWTNQYIYHSAIGEWARRNPNFMAGLAAGDAKWSDNILFTTQVERWAELNDSGYLMPGGQSLTAPAAAAAFNSGQAAMWIMGNWNLAELDPVDGFTPGAFTVPLDNTGSEPAPASALIDNMWAIASWTEKTDSATAFLQWFTEQENAQTYSEANARASTVLGTTVRLSPYESDWNAMQDSAVPYPFTLSPSVNGSGPALLSELTAGQKTVTEVVDGFQDLQVTDNDAAQ